MPAFINLTGHKYGSLVVLGRVGTSNGSPLWACKCDCGRNVNVITRSLQTGNTKSCGCLQKQQLAERNRSFAKHGHSDRERLYGIWHAMRQRCLNANRKDYPRYGGRGISVCMEWNDYQHFRDWAMANGYSDKLSIDRIDFTGNYCPENCRWADAKTQAGNRSTENVRRNLDGTYKRSD